MKTRFLIFLILLSTLIFSASVYAENPKKAKVNTNIEAIEDNLLEGVSSDNLGLRISSAYYLGEYKTERAVLPLVKMLHSESEESARIQAALSLIKIGNPRGVFMVKQAAKFDESKRVRNFCAKFYNAYQKMNVE
ncbi:MAG: HEAT repeat domain-containing protein [Ignavibacteriales bacterium]|nr:HEAT repeat domain-containing protein [Ignavibacteriales bacterium]